MMCVITQQSDQVRQRLMNDASKSSRVKVLATTFNLYQNHWLHINTPYLIPLPGSVFCSDRWLHFLKRGHK